MDGRGRKAVTWGLVGLTGLIVVLMLGINLRRSSRVVLPSAPDSGADALTPLPGGEEVTVVGITPDNVQAAVATLKRPEQYRRSVTVEYLWPGGSATAELTVWALSGWTRVDRTMPDGQVRHSVTDGQTTYIWYNQEKTVYTAPAGDVTADNEQLLPTYEAVLALPPEDIAQADYRMISNVECIYIETVPDGSGRIRRYWISAQTGLLAVAEQLEDGQAVYRMAALTVDAAAVEASDFALPNGQTLPPAARSSAENETPAPKEPLALSGPFLPRAGHDLFS